MIIPVYLAEISSNVSRGRTGGRSAFPLQAANPRRLPRGLEEAAVVVVDGLSAPRTRVGMLPITLNVSLLMAAICTKLLAHHRHGWQIAYTIGAIPSVIIMVGVWCAPESPRWLYVNKGRNSAERSLRKLRNQAGERRPSMARY